MVNRIGQAHSVASPTTAKTTATTTVPEPSTRRRRATRKVCSMGHDVIVALTAGGVGRTHADWYYDLRRGRLCFYGGVLRVIDRAVDDGHPIEFTNQIADWLRWYIADQYDVTPPTPPAATPTP